MKPLIYILEGEFPTGDSGFPLIIRGALGYASETGAPLEKTPEILRTEHGKPYFKDFPVEFSLSHTESMWMCMYHDRPCGFDVQKIRKCSWKKIAERNFGDKERHYVELWGEEGFFQVWTRKEALGKYLGRGFFGEMPQVINEDFEPADFVEAGGRKVFLGEIYIADDIKCAFCAEEEAEPEVRMLI